jgi:hypothetical protein
MSPEIAAKLVSALDAELARRRRLRYEGFVAQWREQ